MINLIKHVCDVIMEKRLINLSSFQIFKEILQIRNVKHRKKQLLTAMIDQKKFEISWQIFMIFVFFLSKYLETFQIMSFNDYEKSIGCSALRASTFIKLTINLFTISTSISIPKIYLQKWKSDCWFNLAMSSHCKVFMQNTKLIAAKTSIIEIKNIKFFFFNKSYQLF